VRGKTVVLGAALAMTWSALAGAQEDFRLKAPPEDPITVRRPQPFPWATATITALDDDDVRVFGGRFLTDSFRRVPGLEVQRVSSTESNVSARSYNDDSSSAQGILALLDNRQVYNEFFGGVFWESLPVTLDDIERVDVIRGPGSFLYGPNAMHGLIHIQTRSPMSYDLDGVAKAGLDEELSISGSYGSYRSNTQSVTYVRREPTFGFKGKVVRDDIDEFQPAGRNAKDKTFLDLRYETLIGGDPKQHLDVGLGASRQKFQTLIPTFGPLRASQFSTEAREEFVRALYTAGSLESWGQLRVGATFTHFDGTSTPAGVVTPDPVYMPFRVILDSGDLDVQYSNQVFESHLMTGGAGVRAATFDTEDRDVSGGRHGTVLEWVFLQDEITLDPAFRLTLGARLDHHSVTGTVVSPRVAAVWRLDEQKEGGNYLRASAGYGYRNPSLRELWFNLPTSSGFRVRGNKDVEPEQMRSFELGYWAQPIPRLRYTANAYYNLVDRLMQFNQDPSNFFVLRPFNVNKDDAFGGELEVEFQAASWLYGFANHSYEIRRDRETGVREPGGPRNKANLGARVEPVRELTGSLWATFFDEVEFVDPAGGGVVIGSVDAYILLNARIAYQPFEGNKTIVFLQAFNLLDHDHREHPQGNSYGLLLQAGFEARW
jgi:iron complex outermembrane recepter protein